MPSARQADGRGRSIKQSNTQPLLQRVDITTQRWLGNIKYLRGLTETLAFCYGKDILIILFSDTGPLPSVAGYIDIIL